MLVQFVGSLHVAFIPKLDFLLSRSFRYLDGLIQHDVAFHAFRGGRERVRELMTRIDAATLATIHGASHMDRALRPLHASHLTDPDKSQSPGHDDTFPRDRRPRQLVYSQITATDDHFIPSASAHNLWQTMRTSVGCRSARHQWHEGGHVSAVVWGWRQYVTAIAECTNV